MFFKVLFTLFPGVPVCCAVDVESTLIMFALLFICQMEWSSWLGLVPLECCDLFNYDYEYSMGFVLYWTEARMLVRFVHHHHHCHVTACPFDAKQILVISLCQSDVCTNTIQAGARIRPGQFGSVNLFSAVEPMAPFIADWTRVRAPRSRLEP